MNKLFLSLFVVATLAVSSYAQEEDDYSAQSMLGKLQQMCVTATGDSNYDLTIMESLQRITDCLDTTVNRTAMQIEASTLLPLGRINELYKKTCTKQNAIMQCFEAEKSVYQACLTQDEINSQTTLMNVIRQVMSYVCEKEDDILVLVRYVVLNGELCSFETRDLAKECFTTTFAKYAPRNPFIPSTFVHPETCSDLTEFQVCVTPVLEKCGRPQVAELFSGLINSVKEKLPCAHDVENNTL